MQDIEKELFNLRIKKKRSLEGFSYSLINDVSDIISSPLSEWFVSNKLGINLKKPTIHNILLKVLK